MQWAIHEFLSCLVNVNTPATVLQEQQLTSVNNLLYAPQALKSRSGQGQCKHNSVTVEVKHAQLQSFLLIGRWQYYQFQIVFYEGTKCF